MSKKDDEMKYHPERVEGMLEGTAKEILEFMINNSGINKVQFTKMTKMVWTDVADGLTIPDVLKVLRLFGYKLVALPQANYMLSGVESYHFVLPEDKTATIDRITNGRSTPAVTLSMRDLQAFGEVYAQKVVWKDMASIKAYDEELVRKSGLDRAIESWQLESVAPFIPQKKTNPVQLIVEVHTGDRKVIVRKRGGRPTLSANGKKLGRPVDPNSKRQQELKARLQRKKMRTAAKNRKKKALELQQRELEKKYSQKRNNHS